jgi:hypothetical protein
MGYRFAPIFAMLSLGLLSAAPVLANDSLQEPGTQPVPSLEDGTRMTLAGVERAILDACERHKFDAAVIEPGVIVAHYERRGHLVDVRIPYSDSSYSIQFVSGKRAGRVVSSLAGDIDASLEAALDRLEMAMNRMKDARPRKSNRINPRNAV